MKSQSTKPLVVLFKKEKKKIEVLVSLYHLVFKMFNLFDLSQQGHSVVKRLLFHYNKKITCATGKTHSDKELSLFLRISLDVNILLVC